MTQEAHELLQKALALPEDERAELAGCLIAIWTQPLIRMWMQPGSKR